MKPETNPKYAPDRLLTSWEVGTLLQVNPTTINKWISQGHIPAFRTPGRHRRIRVADLLRFLQEHEMPVPRELSGDRLRLLVVDDNARYLRSVERLLRAYEDRIDARLADNGIDALLLVGSFRPDVVVLDVFMPGLDGIDVCKRMKARAETRDIDVIVTTAHPSIDVERQALAAGASRVYGKPVDFKALLAGIELPAAAAQP